MEFEITSDLAALRGQQITANFEAVSAWLDGELAPYAGMAVTEEMIPTAKTYRANLRKLKDRVDQYRKEAKSAALAPYNAFEEKIKVLTGKIDAAADNIDRQVKDFEAREKQAKIAELQTFYLESSTDELNDFCPWPSIYNPKWENKGYAIEDAREEILAALNNTRVNLDSIRQVGGDDTAYLLDVYKQTHDINAVIRKSLEIQTAKEREAQRKAREADERQRAAEAEAKAIEVAAEKAKEPVLQEADDDPVVEVAFKVVCRKSELVALGQYMRYKGIKYGRA